MEGRTWYMGLLLLVLGCLLHRVTGVTYEAKCMIDSANSVSWQSISGTIRLRQIDNGPVVIGIRLTGFNTSISGGSKLHGFHVHTSGDVSNSCANVGGHFNPTNQNHGAPTDTERHAGDLGNVMEDDGEVNTILRDSIISLTNITGRHNIMGRAIVVHANEDDLGKGEQPDSLTTGDAGTKIGCCTIVEAIATDFNNVSCDMVADKPGADPAQIITGSIEILQLKSGGMTTYDVDLSGFSTSDAYTTHGFHVHEKGSTDNKCSAAGSHFNPLSVNHGAPENNLTRRHVGDLGNVNETGGKVMVSISDVGSGLLGDNTINGKAIVVHEKEDDLGLGGDDESLKTGNAGKRLGCCVIRASPEDIETSGATWHSLGLLLVPAISALYALLYA